MRSSVARAAACGGAPQRVGRAHAPQIAHQGERSVVAHGDAIDVGHRQRKAGALQQSAELAQIGEWRDARRSAAFDFALGRGKGLPQLGERLAAEQSGEKQSVGLQRTADLHQHARQIVDELQRQRRDDEIERRIAKRQCLLVSGDAAGSGVAVASNTASDLTIVADRPRPASAVRTASPGVPRSSGNIEAAQHRAKPFGKFVGDAVEQECRRTQCTARAAAARG